MKIMQNIRHLKPHGEENFIDSYSTKAKELITLDIKENTDFIMVGLPLSKTSISHSGASLAPEYIRDAFSNFTNYAISDQKEIKNKILDLGDIKMHPTEIIQNQQAIYEGVIDVINKYPQSNFFFLGGDHSVTYSTIRAVAEKSKNIGVIQFDAHLDLRNPKDGGPTNGTPFRRLIEDKLIKGSNLVQIGIRDFANSQIYHNFAKKNDVRTYTMEDVRKETLIEILTKELNLLSESSDEIYLSVDIDSIDQAFAPGCTAIGPGGLTPQELLQGIDLVAKNQKVRAIDIVEIEPTLDFRNMTSRIAVNILLYFMKGKIFG